MDFSSCPKYPRWPRQQGWRFYPILLRCKWVTISLLQTISLKYFQKASSTSNFHFNQERPFISSIPAFSSKDSILIYIGSSLLRFPEKGWKGNYLKPSAAQKSLSSQKYQRSKNKFQFDQSKRQKSKQLKVIICLSNGLYNTNWMILQSQLQSFAWKCNPNHPKDQERALNTSTSACLLTLPV